ncbi:MAG: isoamylase early set domain-containing protein [Nitrospirae bacterium]|nr:isoamylase early set domain-containing protein [Nitrospirota bacterium]MBI4847251.1 isoamylase early set domain-containing protein [Nitrospirota bacterium]
MKKAIEKKAYSATLTAPAKKASSAKSKKAAEPKSLKKQYLKSDNICKVSFRLPKEAAHGAQMVSVVGDFNNWNLTENQMKKLKNGDFTLTLELPCNREYRFRYLIDSNRWENDWFADKYIPNDFGTEDSVVVI